MLASIRIQPRDGTGFPFDLPALAGVGEVAFDAPVTILAGENGSGKSTFLEALAVKARLPALGSAAPARDDTLSGPGELARTMRLSWRRRLSRGFFLRAEDVFGFILRVRDEVESLESELRAAEQRLEGSSELGRTLGTSTYRASIGALKARYGEDPDARSHGETFLHLFRERIVPQGLYLMDEPEAALSPQSQLAFLTLLHAAVAEGSQFVIATHSPLIQAIPGARILLFGEEPVHPVAWEELPSVQLWRDLIDNPASYLRWIWPQEG